MHPQTVTETFLRSRNRIASGFILYQLFPQHPSLPSSVCKMNLHTSESSTKYQLPLVVQCWIILAHLMWFCRFCYEPLVFFLPLGWICPLHVCSRHLAVVCDKWVPKNVLQSKDNSKVVLKRPNLDSIFRRISSEADIFFRRPRRRLFSLPSDSLYLAQKCWFLFLLPQNCPAITWF